MRTLGTSYPSIFFKIGVPRDSGDMLAFRVRESPRIKRGFIFVYFHSRGGAKGIKDLF
jgi:hypothetical protein